MAYTAERVREIINLPAKKLRWRNAWADGGWVEVLKMNDKLLPLHLGFFVCMCVAGLYVRFSSYVENHISDEELMAHVSPADAAAIATAEQKLIDFDEAAYPISHYNERYRNQLLVEWQRVRHSSFAVVRPAAEQEAYRRALRTLFVVGVGYGLIMQLGCWLWFATRPQQSLTYLRRLRTRLESDTARKRIVNYDKELRRLRKRKSQHEQVLATFEKNRTWLCTLPDQELPGQQERTAEVKRRLEERITQKKKEIDILTAKIDAVESMKQCLTREVFEAIDRRLQLEVTAEKNRKVAAELAAKGRKKRMTDAKLAAIERELDIEPVATLDGTLAVCDPSEEGSLALVDDEIEIDLLERWMRDREH